VIVAPTTQYGEYAFILQKWAISEVGRTEDVGYLLFADDGSNVAHADASTLPYMVTKGDLIDNLTGPLAYTFDNYKIEPVITPTVTVVERPLPTLAPPGPDEITIATFNVENLFDTAEPHPDDPPKPTRSQYETRLNKVAEAILALGAPTIIGLQEVENIGVLEDLAAMAQLAAYDYQPVLIEGFDSRGIDVGFLVRGDVASVDGFSSYPGPNDLTSRPPLALIVTVQLVSGPQTITVINNHFLALSAGEEATEPQRTAQAAWNVTLVEEILAADPAAHVVVLGDLNSFYQTLPMDTLQAGGLRHVFEFVEAAGEPLPYTYIFEGKTQALDHILLTEGLWERVTAVTALQINADYPLADPTDASARHVSDHNPLLVRLSFAPDDN
jgi:predicted extracellular nuclease